MSYLINHVYCPAKIIKSGETLIIQEIHFDKRCKIIEFYSAGLIRLKMSLLTYYGIRVATGSF